MPHPEHAVDTLTGPSQDGLGFFTSVLKYLAGAPSGGPPAREKGGAGPAAGKKATAGTAAGEKTAASPPAGEKRVVSEGAAQS
jgi:hypothetical protein